MNHEPSQFCGPPTREGATLHVPLPQSATLSDMCVNGPICVWMSGLSAEEPGSSPPTKRPPTGHHPLPLVGGARSPAARVACAREWNGWVVCAWLRAWLWEYARPGWERMQRREKSKKYKYNILEEKNENWETQQMRLAKVSGEKFCLWKRGWSSDPWKEERWIWKKKNHRHHKDYYFCFELLLS